MNDRLNYPRLSILWEEKDGEANIKYADWPENSNTAEVVVDFWYGNKEEELRKIVSKLPFSVIAIDAGFDPWMRARIYHLIKSNNPIAHLQYQLVKSWSFWAWWEVRIIKTLAVWGLAEIHPGQIIGWHCLEKKS